MLFFKGISEITDDILGTLKIAFSFDQDFNYNLVTPESSYLKIYDGYPREVRSFPCVIISNATIEPKIVGIGKEFRQYTGIGNDQSKEFGGELEFSITFDCVSESISERKQLLDRVVMYLWWNARDYLEEAGIIINSMTSGGESDIEVGIDKGFINQLTVKCWVNWSEIISYDEIESIAITMKEIMDIRRFNKTSTGNAIKIWVEDMINKKRQ